MFSVRGMVTRETLKTLCLSARWLADGACLVARTALTVWQQFIARLTSEMDKFAALPAPICFIPRRVRHLLPIWDSETCSHSATAATAWRQSHLRTRQCLWWWAVGFLLLMGHLQCLARLNKHNIHTDRYPQTRSTWELWTHTRTKCTRPITQTSSFRQIDKDGAPFDGFTRHGFTSPWDFS